MDAVEPRRPVYVLIVLVFGILATSTGSIFTRYAQVAVPSLVIAAVRLTLATLLLSPIAWKRSKHELASLGGRTVFLALLSGSFLALHFATWVSSLAFTSVASSVVFVSSTPVWVALFAPFILKEPVSRLVVAGIILALTGGVIIGLSDACAWGGSGLICPTVKELFQGRAFVGDGLALLGALMAAGYVIIGRRLRRGISLIGYIYLVYGMAALVLIVLMLISGNTPFGYPVSSYIWLLLLALIPQLLGHSSFNWALGYVSAAYVSVILLGEPIGATILAYFLFGESPSVGKIFGAILIFVGIYLASQSEIKKSIAA